MVHLFTYFKLVSQLSIHSMLRTFTCNRHWITCETHVIFLFESVPCVTLLILFVFPSLRVRLIFLILIASQLYQPPCRKPSTQSVSLSGCSMAGCLRRPSPPVESLQTTCSSMYPRVTSASCPASFQGFIIHMQGCFAVEIVHMLHLAASPGVTQDTAETSHHVTSRHDFFLFLHDDQSECRC